MKIVVDSSIIIDYLRGGKKWDEFLNYVPKDTQLFLPTIVIFELFSGSSTRNAHKLKEMIAFIREFQRIDLNENIAQASGEFFRDAKMKIQAADYIIAASALEIGGKVVTLNRKHFEEIPGLSLYAVEPRSYQFS